MFSENFERICEARGLKPGVACTRAGLKQGRAANWKSTGALPKQDELIKLAEVLTCAVSDFFAEDDTVTDVQRNSLDDLEEALLEYFNQLDVMDKAEVLIHVRNLCKRREEEGRGC